jgi:cytoskeletal protein RodZ
LTFWVIIEFGLIGESIGGISMGKPSIFSNNYAKKMRRRKIKYTMIILIIVAVLVAIFFRSNIFNFKQNNSITNSKGNKSATNKSETPKVVTKPVIPEKAEEEKSYPVDLSSGVQIKLVYEEKDNNKIFKYVSPIDSVVITDISPSKKAIVILDSKNQDILYYDIEGKKQDLTKREYTSSDATIFTKENQLNKNAAYIWHSSPRFLDEEKIAYISQLPWFNNAATKYVWIVNIKTGQHQTLEKLSGENLSFGELNEKGLMVKANDKTYYLKSDGSFTE